MDARGDGITTGMYAMRGNRHEHAANRRRTFTTGMHYNEHGDPEGHYTSVSAKSARFWLGLVSLLLTCIISGGTIMAAIMRPIVQQEISAREDVLRQRLRANEQEDARAHARIDGLAADVAEHRKELLDELRAIRKDIRDFAHNHEISNRQGE